MSLEVSYRMHIDSQLKTDQRKICVRKTCSEI